jgi:hypothetical protein
MPGNSQRMGTRNQNLSCWIALARRRRIGSPIGFRNSEHCRMPVTNCEQVGWFAIGGVTAGGRTAAPTLLFRATLSPSPLATAAGIHRFGPRFPSGASSPLIFG